MVGLIMADSAIYSTFAYLNGDGMDNGLDLVYLVAMVLALDLQSGSTQ
jgi:hypothetical protein